MTVTTGSHDLAKRVVAGIDGSPASLQALRWALDYADRTQSSVEVVIVWDWPKSLGWSMPFPTGFDPEESARQTLDESIAAIHGDFPNVVVQGRVEQGHPAPILVESSRDAFLLVVGNRGHGEFAGMLLGSVSEYCVAHARCPVVVYRGDP